MNHIFVSYSRKDEKQVTAFVEELRRRGFEIWQDISGKRSGIPYSVKWFEVIEEAIFMAYGAIIFQTDAWERSVPCQREYQLIQDTTLPVMYISMSRLLTEEAAVVNEAAYWCDEQIKSQENTYCRWMLSGAYRTYKKLPIERYFPTGKQIFNNWRWIKECNRLFRQRKFQGPWVESLGMFLRKAKRKLIWNMTGRVLIRANLFAIFIWILVVFEIEHMAQIANYTGDSESMFVSMIQRIGEYDPVQVVQLIKWFNAAVEEYAQQVQKYGDEEYILKNQGDVFAEYVNRDYYGQNRVLTDLVCRNYPTAFYGTVTECPVDMVGIKGASADSQYTVTLSDTTSQVFIYDSKRETTRQLLLEAIPEVYCFSESGNELIIAAANNVYVYDLLGEAGPGLLTYNFENIIDLIKYENKIYAVTENNHVVVWDDPFLERKIDRQGIASGEIRQLDDGRVMAVYVGDGCLIKNVDNSEEIYPLSFEGIVDMQNITVSSDCAYAAVSYRPEGSNSDWIGLIDLTNGELKKTYDMGCTIMGYTFWGDDAFLAVTCSGRNKIARINLETGEMQESIGYTVSSPYSMIAYKDKIIVCDITGRLAVYNENLELTGDYRVIGYAAPQKQLAVSQKYDSLLTAGRGGNVFRGSYQTWLSSDKQSIFVPVDGEPMISTTSVAVSDTGEYAAYGNAGGSIYIWDVGAMEQVRNEHCIPESIINLLFSNDTATLYVLGSSGTIYEIDLYDMVAECVPEDSESIWQMNMNRAEEIRQNMYNLGLSVDK